LLRTDHLDIVLLHSDGRDAWIVEHSGALEALAALKAQGKLRVFGISTKSPEGAMLALERTAAPVDVLMLTINPAYDADRPVAAEAARNGVGVLVKKALISGHVAGQTGGHAGREAPTPEACIRHALGSEGVSSVIVGTLSPANLRANVVAACRAVAGGCPHDGLVF
jgi:aryl-alcohol dehydrogenase-like predicted oxidoreductase